MILLRRWKTASYKHQIVFSSHTETLGIFLNVNLILVILGLTYLLGSAPITTAPDCCSVVLTVTSLLYSGYSTCSRQHNLSNARFSLQFFCASPNAFTPHSLTLATLSRGHLVQQFVSAFCLCSRRLITSSPSLSLCFCFRNFSKEVILSSLFPMGSLSQSTVPS